MAEGQSRPELRVVDCGFEFVGAAQVMEALDCLMEDAKAGRLVGIAFAAQFKGQQYVCHVDGEAYRNPTFALGMVAMLDDHLRALIRERRDAGF